jgi:protein TonB
MKSLKLAKKLLLSLAAIVALTVPLLAGLAVQEAALAQGSSDAVDEYLPVVKVAPVYPARAAEIGLEGYVVVQYTVNTLGSTENVVVLESSSNLFDQSAVDSALKYKYRPRLVNGAPVAVEGVTTKIIYALQSDPADAN